MDSISVRRYDVKYEDIWNSFNKNSKNSLFMFDRGYMDYHADRFVDHSLLFFKDDELVAILPMSEKEDVLISHGGLTHGGLVLSNKIKQHGVNECFETLLDYCKKNGFKELCYKQIPHIYHSQPSEEDSYALFVNNASLKKIEASTTINLSNPLKMPKGRKSQISKAKREGVEVLELDDNASFCSFIELENEVLYEHHNTTAVHSSDEINLLHSRFPDNIKLFGAIKDEKMIAGVMVFEYETVVHTQYMAANDLARDIGALDLTVKYIIDMYKESKKWLDFGISTENDGLFLNKGLISQKEGFGGRTIAYYTWSIKAS